MQKPQTAIRALAMLALGLCAAPASAQLYDSGSTGADGDFAPTENTQVVLPPDGVLNYANVVIPAGVMHNPIADEECQVLVFEKKSTAHTGSKQTDQTRSLDDQLRPI